MMPQGRLPLVVGTLVVILLGVGYGVWMLYGQHQQALQVLAATQSTLAQRQETLSLVEDERRKLAESYETLKERKAQAEEENQRLAQASEQLTQELTTLTNERSALQRQLDGAKKQADSLQQQLGTLEQARSSLTTETEALNVKLNDALASSQTQASQLTQLKQALAEQTEKEQQLTANIVELSKAQEALSAERTALEAKLNAPATFEETASHPVEASEQAAAFFPRAPHEDRPQVQWRLSFNQPPKTEPEGVEQVEQFLTSLSQGPPKRYRPEDERKANFYLQMARAHLAVRHYEKAAIALEQALTFTDDPEAHRQLAALYSGPLRRPELASPHRLKATRGSSLDTTPARPQVGGYPRNTWTLLFDTLAKQ